MKIKNGVLVSINKSKDIKRGHLTVPDGVTAIGEATFDRCRKLTSITLPDSMTSIGRQAFFGCVNLKSIIIPYGVTSIGDVAFYDCVNLTNITIPDSVTSIGDFAFDSCGRLCYNEYDNAYYLGNETNPYLVLVKAKSNSIAGCLINENTKFIYCTAFTACNNLTSITIPGSVKKIMNFAFCNCKNLANVVILDGVTFIGNSSFRACSNLTSVAIPESVKSIERSSFYECSKLTKTDNKYYYKAFNKDLKCRGFKYEENKWFECEGIIKLCENGFHACKNAFDLFNYYYGEFNEDVVIYKVELEDISDEHEDDSKVAARKIRLVEKVNSYVELLN